MAEHARFCRRAGDVEEHSQHAGGHQDRGRESILSGGVTGWTEPSVVPGCSARMAG